VTDLKNDELLELRKQFQDAYFMNESFLWSGVRITITVIVALLSAQSGLMFWASINSQNNPALLIIPFGILILCIIGTINAKRGYRNLLEHIACMAKVEDELNLSRKNKDTIKFFRNDKSILCDRWIEPRTKYKTTKEFKEESYKIKFTSLTSYAIIKLIYIFISGFAIVIFIINL
jgi:hypothetical protein